LVDLSTHEVWEIKPILTGYAAGSAQLAIYLTVLNTQDPAHHIWIPGYSYSPPAVVPIKAGTIAFVFRSMNGVILYEVVDETEGIFGLATLASFLALKDLEAGIGTAAILRR
jgi:hypothetical protein